MLANLFQAVRGISVRWAQARKTAERKGERGLVRETNAFPGHVPPHFFVLKLFALRSN